MEMIKRKLYKEQIKFSYGLEQFSNVFHIDTDRSTALNYSHLSFTYFYTILISSPRFVKSSIIYLQFISHIQFWSSSFLQKTTRVKAQESVNILYAGYTFTRNIIIPSILLRFSIRSTTRLRIAPSTVFNARMKRI